METRKISSTQWLAGIGITLLIAFGGTFLFVLIYFFIDNLPFPPLLLRYVLIITASVIALIGVHWRRYQYILFLRSIKHQLQVQSTLTRYEIAKGRVRVVSPIVVKIIIYAGIFIIAFGLIIRSLDIWESLLLGVAIGLLGEIFEYPEIYHKYLLQLVEPHLEEAQKTFLQQFQRKWYDCFYYLIVLLVVLLIYIFK